ncbi:MAG: hypothetical protein K6F00_07670 [Lachnospiraceae bacterium]|nr:hypothetical protein [Lachnospiraceae bacterium]
MSMEIGNVTSQIMDLKTDKPGVTRKEEVKTGFANVRDYTKYLQEKYSYMNVGEVSMKGIRSSVNVSPAFLDKCNKDPQKAAWLEENLAAIPGCTEKSIANCMGTLIAQGWEIDANGNMSAWSMGSSDPDGKIAKENAKRRVAEEKAAKEKQQKKLAEEKAQEKLDAKRRAEIEAFKQDGSFMISAVGTDVKSVTEQFVSKMNAEATGIISSFDAKA